MKTQANVAEKRLCGATVSFMAASRDGWGDDWVNCNSGGDDAVRCFKVDHPTLWGDPAAQLLIDLSNDDYGDVLKIIEVAAGFVSRLNSLHVPDDRLQLAILT